MCFGQNGCLKLSFLIEDHWEKWLGILLGRVTGWIRRCGAVTSEVVQHWWEAEVLLVFFFPLFLHPVTQCWFKHWPDISVGYLKQHVFCSFAKLLKFWGGKGRRRWVGQLGGDRQKGRKLALLLAVCHQRAGSWAAGTQGVLPGQPGSLFPEWFWFKKLPDLKLPDYFIVQSASWIFL